MGVANEHFLERERDNDGWVFVDGRTNPQVVLESLVVYLLQHVLEIFIALLSQNPGF